LVTVVLETDCLYRASEKAVLEAELGRRPGVWDVEANPVAPAEPVEVVPSYSAMLRFVAVIR
jgi:hypothetical protein